MSGAPRGPEKGAVSLDESWGTVNYSFTEVRVLDGAMQGEEGLGWRWAPWQEGIPTRAKGAKQPESFHEQWAACLEAN